MGRWTEKARKLAAGIPTKLAEPSSVGFVGTSANHFQGKNSADDLGGAHEPNSNTTWLHLLVLIDGKVIQRCGEQETCHVEEMARQQYGNDLAAVVAVPSFQRPLSETEIAQALAGTLATPEPVAPPPPSSAWLARVARLLGIRPTELLENGHLEQHDLHELAYTDAVLVANHIRSSPAWINRQ